MKKISFIFLIVLSLFIFPSVILAKGNQQDKDPVNNKVETSSQGNQQGQGRQVGVENKGIEASSQNLNRVIERRNNPETGKQIRSMVQNHEKIQTRTKAAIKTMSQRNKVLKLMIGPDYKNAGQVRSDVVGLRNDINKLEQIKEESLPSDNGDIQGAIDELQTEADGIENQLTEQLSGFSFFGWLSKLINK
jgi:hypothetical protein